MFEKCTRANDWKYPSKLLRHQIDTKVAYARSTYQDDIEDVRCEPFHAERDVEIDI